MNKAKYTRTINKVLIDRARYRLLCQISHNRCYFLLENGARSISIHICNASRMSTKRDKESWLYWT